MMLRTNTHERLPSDRSCMISTSEKAFAVKGSSFTGTGRGGGVMLFVPTASVDLAGSGIACSNA